MASKETGEKPAQPAKGSEAWHRMKAEARKKLDGKK